LPSFINLRVSVTFQITHFNYFIDRRHFNPVHYKWGHAVVQLVEALRYLPQVHRLHSR